MIARLLKGAVKGAVVGKVLQIAERELRKPENQRKIKEGLRKVSRTRR
ncbi:hypothetical protein [Auraticoccus cholistanensis]|nr:hypothetical protein [Auraticoccus cholistanensis]